VNGSASLNKYSDCRTSGPPIEESPNSGRSGFLNAREPPEKVESPWLRRPPNHSSNDGTVAFSRVQYCLGKAVQCDRLALDSTHPDMKFIYRELAQHWRDISRQVEQLEKEESDPPSD
jgi:hypothetical protein